MRSGLDHGMLDAVATLVAGDRTTHEAKLTDALSWLCKVLEKSGRGRYKAFLQDIGSSAADPKLRK